MRKTKDTGANLSLERIRYQLGWDFGLELWMYFSWTLMMKVPFILHYLVGNASLARTNS